MYIPSYGSVHQNHISGVPYHIFITLLDDKIFLIISAIMRLLLDVWSSVNQTLLMWSMTIFSLIFQHAKAEKYTNAKGKTLVLNSPGTSPRPFVKADLDSNRLLCDPRVFLSF